MEPARELVHPYIVRDRAVCGGEPTIRGTRFTVRAVVQYVLREGLSPEELVFDFGHLNLASIYDALSYYYDHKAEVDRLLEENREENWKKKE
jgi:uncharacterized protein (DUF433 family)